MRDPVALAVVAPKAEELSLVNVTCAHARTLLAFSACANIRSVTSQDSDFGRFRRALDSGNLTVALVEARQLQHVGLGEALELVLLIRDQRPERFCRRPGPTSL